MLRRPDICLGGIDNMIDFKISFRQWLSNINLNVPNVLSIVFFSAPALIAYTLVTNNFVLLGIYMVVEILMVLFVGFITPIEDENSKRIDKLTRDILKGEFKIAILNQQIRDAEKKFVKETEEFKLIQARIDNSLGIRSDD